MTGLEAIAMITLVIALLGFLATIIFGLIDIFMAPPHNPPS